MSTAKPVDWMRTALKLAARGTWTTRPNPRVGCVVVKDGKLAGQGWHRKAGEPHAEILALAMAAEAAKQAEVYVTLEPCTYHGRTPPCVDALLEQRPQKVYVAMEDPNQQVAGKGIARLQEAGIAVETGLLQQEATELNRGYVKRHTQGRPWVTVKVAQSLDGGMAYAGQQEQRWLTGKATQADVHRWRARSCAIVSGAASIRIDNCQLNPRLGPGYEVTEPLRIALDPQFSLSPELKFWTTPGPKLWVGSLANKPPPAPAETSVCTLPASQNGKLDLAALLEKLSELEINELLVESGPRLTTAFIAAGLADELLLYLAPCLLGAGRCGMLELAPEQLPNYVPAYVIQESQSCGTDLRVLLARQAAAASPPSN